jgi:PRTRC genetic system ThiF family protein
MKHAIHGELVGRAVKVLLVGGGGSGSRMLDHLICLHRAMLAKGHPAGLYVTLVDDDRVSPANVGRQAFYPTDVGSYKATTLINRANMALGTTTWSACVAKLTTGSTGVCEYDIVIGCVDNRSARLAILRSLERAGGGNRYYLDLGNRSSDGQVVLGEVTSSKSKNDSATRLPHVGELFPELIDAALDKVEDDIPSCSLAEALEKQSLFINTAVSLFAADLLDQLFTKGEIEHHGAFINLQGFRVMPLAVDPETWARFGVQRSGKREKVVQPSRRLAHRRKVT